MSCDCQVTSHLNQLKINRVILCVYRRFMMIDLLDDQNISDIDD